MRGCRLDALSIKKTITTTASIDSPIAMCNNNNNNNNNNNDNDNNNPYLSADVLSTALLIGGNVGISVETGN